MSLETVNSLKAALSKDDANVGDVLSRLEEVNMTLELLKKSLIGKALAKHKNDEDVGPRVRALVKKWKQVAANTSSSDGNAKKAARRDSLGDSVRGDAKAEAEWAHLPTMRQNVCKKLYESLLRAKSAMVADGINAEVIDHLLGPRAVEIEDAIQEKYKYEKKDYIDKARSLSFNFKKNVPLCQEVILGQIQPVVVVSLTPEQLASDEAIKERAQDAAKLIESKRLDWEQSNEDKINKMCGIEGDLLKASLFTCGRCKSTKTTSTQKQTRSADEPMTVFVFCTNCGKRWKC